MLQQAIIDAEALKDAAVKNAETLVLEQYSDKIKDAVQMMLEQEEDPMAMDDAAGDAPAAGEEGAQDAAEETNVTQHLSVGTDIDLDERVEIPLDSLMEQLQLMTEDLEQGLGMIEEAEEDDELNEEEDIFEGDDSEEIDLDEELLADLNETLKVDVHSAKTGWMTSNESLYELAEEEILALEQDSEVREQKAAMRKAVKELQNVNESLKNDNDELTSSLQEAGKFIVKLRDTVVVLKEKLEKTAVSNARLLYQNKALNSTSLNERQKQKLAEAVSKATTIEEAKVIYETLHSTVGSTNPAKQPKSLSEAVEKSSSVILAGRRKAEKSQRNEPAFDRWKFLAGINKDN
tara:strand:- start:222 stop:1265 length:1044 start_codon:yes stop_codon:yes gene_type:complete